MEEYPANRAEFERWFASERSCLDYLFRVRWPGGFQCPKCRCIRAGVLQRGLFRCRRCDFQTSVTAGTILQGTRKPIRTWFEAIWHLADFTGRVSAAGLQQALGLGSYRTAWLWMHKLRSTMLGQDREPLEGIVQTGKVAFKTTEGLAPVLVAVQYVSTEADKIQMILLPNEGPDAMSKAVAQAVKSGTSVQTVNQRECNVFPESDYRHEAVFARDEFLGLPLPPAVRSVAESFSKWLLDAHQGAVGSRLLEYYLDEFTFKFNNRHISSRGQLFHLLLRRAVTTKPLIASDGRLSVRQQPA